MSKKIVLIIVEGKTEELALGRIFTKHFQSSHVHIKVVHHDITSKYGNHPSNIVKKIHELVKTDLGSIYKAKDVERIIHITDTDGTYIDPSQVERDSSKESPYYTKTSILTNYVGDIIARNSIKSKNLDKLASTQCIATIPYGIFYMSVNLDHVLYNRMNLAARDKKIEAHKFSKMYGGDLEKFTQFICSPDIYVSSQYLDSWKYIREANNSLSRYSNLGLIFTPIIAREEN